MPASGSRPPEAPRPGPLSWVGWIAAAVLAVAAGVLTQFQLGLRADLLRLREAEAVAEVRSQNALQLLEAERLLSQGQVNALREMREQLAKLERQADPQSMEIIEVRTADGTARSAEGSVVWNPIARRGLLLIERMPDAPEDRHVQLWILDSQGRDPVSAGVFNVKPGTGQARFPFAPTDPEVVASGFRLQFASPTGASTGSDGEQAVLP